VLPACGRVWTLLGSRKNSKRGKCSKMPQNPTASVHMIIDRLYGQHKFIYQYRGSEDFPASASAAPKPKSLLDWLILLSDVNKSVYTRTLEKMRYTPSRNEH